jgi:class 3 adenylate cyclase
VIAALSMREAIGRYNQELQAQQLPPLDVRIGVHKGKVVAGLVGSRKISSALSSVTS